MIITVTSPVAVVLSAALHQIPLSDEHCKIVQIYLAYKWLPPDSVVVPGTRLEGLKKGSWNDTVNLHRL